MYERDLALFDLISRRPFRRSAIDQESAQDVQAKIARYGVNFSVPFGGYKGSGLLCSPSLNWAEVVWMDYLRSYAEPMTRLVSTEIEFALTYLSGVLGFINLTTDAEQTCYLQDLKVLADAMSGDGVRFRLVDLTELAGGRISVLSEVQANYERLRLKNHDVSREKIASAARNCRNPDDAYDAALRCEAMEMLPARRQFNKFGKHVQLTHVRGASRSVHIGSCRSSVVQPWVGAGVFEYREGVLMPRILGRTRLACHEVVQTRLEDVELSLSKRALGAAHLFPQLKRVPIVETRPESDHVNSHSLVNG